MICKRGADQAYVQMIYTCLHLSKHFFFLSRAIKIFSFRVQSEDHCIIFQSLVRYDDGKNNCD